MRTQARLNVWGRFFARSVFMVAIAESKSIAVIVAQSLNEKRLEIPPSSDDDLLRPIMCSTILHLRGYKVGYLAVTLKSCF